MCIRDRFLCCGTGLLLFDATAAQAQGIVAHSPVTNAVGVNVTANITASFDTTVNAATVTTRTFTVRSSFRGLVPDAATVSGATLTVDPSRNFFTGEQVQVVSTAAISSTGGAPLKPTQWGFTAGPVQPRCVGSFTEMSTGLPAVGRSSAVWGDYDNDGDLDILLTGVDGGGNPLAKVYRNDAGNFVDSGASLIGVQESSAAWGDYDNDGDLDLLLTGAASGGARVAAIYNNNLSLIHI